MANIRMLRNLHCDVHVACNFVQGNNTSPQRIAVFQNELAALGVTCHQIDFARSPFHLLQNHRAYQQLKAVLLHLSQRIHLIASTAIRRWAVSMDDRQLLPFRFR